MTPGRCNFSGGVPVFTDVGEHVFSIEFLDGGVQAYACNFG
jgi:hypothetical protein